MQHNADMATNAIITKLIIPCGLWIIIIGVVVIAFEFLKATIRKRIKKHRAKTLNGR